MPVEQPFNIYQEQLTSLYHGLALWRPNPVESIYNQVSIGDVGYISDGVFIRMFNVTLPWDDQSNRRLAEPERYDSLIFASVIRETFGQVDYYSRRVSREENAGNTWASSPEQAEGYREDAIRLRMFSDYIRDNADIWFNWSRSVDLPVERMDDLILVTGCTMVNSWAAAVFDDYNADAQVSLGSKILNNGGASFVWNNIRGTVEYHDSQLDPSNTFVPQNRCVFIRGFRAKRVLFWTRPMRAAAEPDSDDSDDPETRRNSEIQANRVPYVAEYPSRDPLSGVLDYIVEKCLEDANDEDIIAIAHDDDLQRIESEDPVRPSQNAGLCPNLTSSVRMKETLTADAVQKFLRENKFSVLIENGAATLQGVGYGLFSHDRNPDTDFRLF
ncbi:hypothetical protein DFH94DRAFT_695423 [Russula ochroleuca]|uniref:Uncharacterized protein n=1 Tax=Russula ochroleuca TaxID=152965 RepID=A0A9P5MND2_9AGAM|nr:hypothetical protein DFH94DRAFT_695423 [Russula ochroleuca]